MRKNILIVVLTILCIAPNVFAQSVSVVGRTTDPNARETARIKNQINREQSTNDINTMSRVKTTTGSVSSTSYYNMTEKLIKKIKKTGFEDDYKQFLKQPNTGLVKLLKESDCFVALAGANPKDVEKRIKSCPGYFVPGKAVYYSFRHDDYVASVRSDLGLMDDSLLSVGMLNQSLLVDLGEVNFDELNSQSEGIKFLFDFVPATTIDLARDQRESIMKGVKDKNYSYSNKVKFKKDSVIGLRVVAYENENKTNPRIHTKLDLLSGDERKDIIVVFKVIDKDDDGSVVLLWKQLQRKASPTLIVE